MHRLVGYTAGSLAAAEVPAAFFFLRPMRVVGRGGGSYLGLSFYVVGRTMSDIWLWRGNMISWRVLAAYLLVLVISAVAGAAHAGLILTLHRYMLAYCSERDEAGVGSGRQGRPTHHCDELLGHAWVSVAAVV